MVDREKQATLVSVLGEKMNRQLLYYLDMCARCAICKDACHQYVSTGDVSYLPAYRAELIRRVYKKHFTRSGKLLPGLFEGRDPDDHLLDELQRVTYACTGCRRCMYYCPFSIDTTWILAAAKAMLIAAGREPRILSELAGAAIVKGESVDVFKDIMLDMLKDTEEELRARVGDPAAGIPVDREGADMLYAPLAGVHTILPVAIIFHKAGASWTLSMFESSNYGYFLGDVGKAKAIAARIVEEAKRLGVKEVVVGECGHGYRVLEFLYETWAQEKLPFRVSSIIEVIARLVKEGRITLAAGKITEPVTYHDPCQLARNAGFYEEPRYIVRQAASDFRELSPNREKNWCCGGGGGLVAQTDFDDFRMKTGEKKADQIRESGARTLVTPCENCRLQIDGLNEHYDLGVEVKSLADLVVEAMEGLTEPAAEDEEPESAPMAS